MLTQPYSLPTKSPTDLVSPLSTPHPSPPHQHFLHHQSPSNDPPHSSLLTVPHRLPPSLLLNPPSTRPPLAPPRKPPVESPRATPVIPLSHPRALASPARLPSLASHSPRTRSPSTCPVTCRVAHPPSTLTHPPAHPKRGTITRSTPPTLVPTMPRASMISSALATPSLVERGTWIFMPSSSLSLKTII